jgi:hypothetical protein
MAAAPDERLAKLVLSLREQGVTDPATLEAIEQTPRDLFTEDLFKERSFEDQALPIACGQTISQPYIVGLMTQALTLDGRSRVLEIGTGSGYQTAVLARIARLVYTVERYRTLLGEAEARFKTLDLLNVVTKFGDGGLGWPEQVKEVEVTRQGRRDIEHTHSERRVDLRGRAYYWMNFEGRRPRMDDGSDIAAIAKGRISVTPIHIDLTHQPTVHALKGVLGGPPPKVDA